MSTPNFLVGGLVLASLLAGCGAGSPSSSDNSDARDKPPAAGKGTGAGDDDGGAPSVPGDGPRPGDGATPGSGPVVGGGDDDDGTVDGDDGDDGDGSTTEPSPAEDEPPALLEPHAVTVDEEEALEVTLEVEDSDGDEVRVRVTGLPPGARFDAATRTLTFRPDFIQGGQTWDATVHLTSGGATVEETLSIEVRDTIQPPAPRVVNEVDLGSGVVRVVLDQVTDDFLDTPDRAGRSIRAHVMRPASVPEGERRPVRIYLHGFGAQPWGDGWEGEYRISPHDPDNTYWLGAKGSDGTSPPVTLRRVAHLLEYVLETYPGADPDNVYVEGGSMGGAGAMTFGLLYGRHLSSIQASLGNAIPRNHKPSRVSQLSGVWGSPDDDALDDGDGMSPWDRADFTRILQDEPAARDNHVFLKHSKDDPTVLFSAVVHESPLTGETVYSALQRFRAGHFAAWDEGAHGPSDPVLGGGWWDSGWNPVFDDVTYLRRDLAFPAFTNSSHDDDPGTGDGNGQRGWNNESGYAGNVSTPGDTGWDGDIAGAINRFLRWDARGIEDTLDSLEIPLFALDGPGGQPPRAGYPTTGDLPGEDLPIIVDVTPRRVQRFVTAPGEEVRWTFGDLEGTAVADDDGSVTVPELPVTVTPTVLRLERVHETD